MVEQILLNTRTTGIESDDQHLDYVHLAGSNTNSTPCVEGSLDTGGCTAK